MIFIKPWKELLTHVNLRTYIKYGGNMKNDTKQTL